MRHHWTLDPSIAYLNHGAYGACPKPVLEAQAELRARMERQPTQFFQRDLEGLLDAARAAIGAFVGADPDDLAFVPNATTGVNTVIRSLDLVAGDELLTTDHAYNACRNALRWHEARGVKVATAQVPWPCERPGQVVDAVLAAATPRTRLALIDHVTSPTGLIYPVAEIVGRLAERGVETLIDGAHAPGMLGLDLRGLGSGYYTGNFHKWVCAPKGAAFLWVRRDRQALVKPIAHGHGLNSRRTDRSPFRLQMDWIGTDDPSGFLAVPAALRFLGSLLPGGWDELMRRNRALALRGRAIVCDALALPPPAPEEMIGSLATALLPDSAPQLVPGQVWHPLQRALLEKHGVEVPVIAFGGGRRQHLRLSAQAYNDESQYGRLAEALRVELRGAR